MVHACVATLVSDKRAWSICEAGIGSPTAEGLVDLIGTVFDINFGSRRYTEGAVCDTQHRMEAGGMSGWNQAPLPRDQILLFRETLGDRIPEDHSVRLFAEILDCIDWASWEQHYVLVAGQPPIHPKIMAGAILYGLTHGLRSSRRLEWACANAIDFMWLVEGRTIDHSTFCDFRTKFKRELKDLFRQIGRVAMHLGLIRRQTVARIQRPRPRPWKSD